MKTNRAKVVTITSRKDAVGKTTITALLARYFTEIEGKKVIVIDLDERGGITTILHGKTIPSNMYTAAKLLTLEPIVKDMRKRFLKAIIKINLDMRDISINNSGQLYLLPEEPMNDIMFDYKSLESLNNILHDLNISKDHVILVDTSTDLTSILIGLRAADIVFLPLRYGMQEIIPTVEILLMIRDEQRKNGKPFVGGLIINPWVDSVFQWDQIYEKEFNWFFDFKNQYSNQLLPITNIFIHLEQSQIIQKRKFMNLPFSDGLLDTAKELAYVIQENAIPKRRNFK